jgi:putative ABC transport system substrate-binding protein
VTGITVAAGPEIVGKRLELLKEIVPAVKTVAFVTLPGAGYTEPARKAAEQLSLRLVLAEVNTSEQLAEALTRLAREKTDGLVVGTMGFLGTQAPLLAAFAAERHLPAVYAVPEAVDAGGLAYFGIDILDINRRAADYVDRILRGAKPWELPVELPKKFEVVINLKTARALGVKIPQSILLRADRVIE